MYVYVCITMFLHSIREKTENKHEEQTNAAIVNSGSDVISTVSSRLEVRFTIACFGVGMCVCVCVGRKNKQVLLL